MKTETPKAKACARCGKTKPADAFRANPRMKSGLDSWCKACRVDRVKQWRKDNPNYERVNDLTRRTYHDPIAYSYAVCYHVEEFVSRRIERFEKRTGMEAPPHLVAIRNLAQQVLDDHPESDGQVIPTRTCAHCGDTFNGERARRKDVVYCSESCKGKAQRRRTQVRDPDKNKRRMRQRTERLNADPEAKAAYLARRKQRRDAARSMSSDANATVVDGVTTNRP